MLPSIEDRLAQTLSAKSKQISITIMLLDEGATVPFIARYRKEATGGLTDVQLRLLVTCLHDLRELEKRRTAIISAIEKQNKMTPALLDAITNTDDKTYLEDLYLPFRKKRRTKAQIAHEAGLQPLADSLLNSPKLQPDLEAAQYLMAPFTTSEGDNPGVADSHGALEGARHILMERFAENAFLLQSLREYLLAHGMVTSKVAKGKQEAGAKVSDYFDYSEAFRKIPSHRALALLRGWREKILTVAICLDSDIEKPKQSTLYNPCELMIAKQFGIQRHNRPADSWLMDTVHATWRTKCLPHLETELLNSLHERAENEAIHVFARNLSALLLAPPAGPQVTMGLDPGLRTGTKVAIVDTTGKVLTTATVYPHPPHNHWDDSLHSLKILIEKYHVTLIAIGNGTASRETDQLAKELIRILPQVRLMSVVVSEAGASVYSASPLASQELPDMDVSLRGAVSIARRVQDPLAELVKIDPKSIGVGQYQHDIDHKKLAHSLDGVIEDCVNAVGVDVNTASPALLERVSGLNRKIAQNIITYRDSNGRFTSRTELRQVPHLGEKTFEQAAGFLRITQGNDPLDASAVHPESYPLVKQILANLQLDIRSLIGNQQALKSLDPTWYITPQFGLPTILDILSELEKPGRDPRPSFTTAVFQDNVKTLSDLHPDMILEGVITNVVAFGAFVDIGVHVDGLVHVSALTNTFVKDPHAVVKVGQVVKVKVLEIDEKRKRITLTMRLTDLVTTEQWADKRERPGPLPQKQSKKTILPDTAMRIAFSRINKQNQ